MTISLGHQGMSNPNSNTMVESDSFEEGISKSLQHLSIAHHQENHKLPAKTSNSDMHISGPLLKAFEAMGFHEPTHFQAACIPLVLTGRDICGTSVSGFEKIGFILPTLERLQYLPKDKPAIRVIILASRDLGIELHRIIEKLTQFITDIRCCLLISGQSLKVQESALISLPDIVVATPGCFNVLFKSISVHLDELAVLILDEADHLLDLQYNLAIFELIELCPKRRQTMLFSSTRTRQVDELIKLTLNSPVRLSADPSSKQPVRLTELVVRIRRLHEKNQEAVLLALCSRTYTSKVIILSGTPKAAHRLKVIFGLVGFKAAELHTCLTHVQRFDALQLFMKQEVDFLMATEVSIRGLNNIGGQTVINFAFHGDISGYVAQVRLVDREGYAVTFVTDNNRSLMKSFVRRRAGSSSRLRSQTVPERSIITEWSTRIEQLEEQVSLVIKQDRALRNAERLLEQERTKAAILRSRKRKAEMEAVNVSLLGLSLNKTLKRN